MRDIIVTSFCQDGIELLLKGNRYWYSCDTWLSDKVRKMIDKGAGWKAVNYLKKKVKGISLDKRKTLYNGG